jgi:hypothetical protein
MNQQDFFAALPEPLQPGPATEPQSIHGGRNNQVFAYRDSAGQQLILKAYNPTAVSEATRLQREFSFLETLSQGGINNIPQPLFADHDRNIGVYSFIQGDRLEENWAQSWAVNTATQFLTACQTLRSTSASSSVPNASEACFRLSDHAAMLERRLARLTEIEDPDAGRFFTSDLKPAAEKTVAVIQNLPHADQALPNSDRWLSPSDFGFHNALLTGPASLSFLDFEHAGWDDPAKLIVDFCNQPDHILPDNLATTFEENITAIADNPAALRDRLHLLRPLYQLKWACILLNEFLPFGIERRNFLGRSAPEQIAAEKQRQLQRAQLLLKRAQS